MPVQRAGYGELTWIAPTYPAVHRVLTHPSYAGAYVYGRTRRERRVGTRRPGAQPGPSPRPTDWQVLIVDHHPGYIDWATYEANQARIGANTRPQAHQPGSGAIREGTALLQGLAICGAADGASPCTTRARNSTPGYHCAGRELVNGRGVYASRSAACRSTRPSPPPSSLRSNRPASSLGHRRRGSPRGRPRHRP